MDNPLVTRLARVNRLVTARLDRLSDALPPVKEKPLPLDIYLARASLVKDPAFQSKFTQALQQWQVAGGKVTPDAST
jgi:hypothetical protein